MVTYETIKALGQIKSGKALYVLYKLGSRPLDDDIIKLAHREAQRLKFKGF